MTDVYQGEGVVVGAGEEDSVVAVGGCGFLAVVIGGGGGIGDHGLVAFRPGVVGNPVTDGGEDGGIQLILVGSAGGLGVLVDVQGGDGGVKVGNRRDFFAGQRLGGSLSSLDGGGLLGVGVGGVAVVIGSAALQELAGGEIIGVIGEGRILGVILRFGGPEIRVFIGQGIGVVAVIRVCQGVHCDIVPVVFLRGAVAELGLQVILEAGEAVEGGIGLAVIDAGVDVGNLLIGQGKARGLRSIRQGVDSLGVVLGGVQEIIRPGAAGFLVNHLLVQGLGGIEAEHGGVAAIVIDEGVDGVHVEIAELGVADVVVAYGQCGGLPLPDAAAGEAPADAHTNGYHHHYGQNGDEQGGIKLQLFGFLLLGTLLFRHFGGVFFVAELLLAGCAHGIKSSHFVLLVITRLIFTHRPRYYNPFFLRFQGAIRQRIGNY